MLRLRVLGGFALEGPPGAPAPSLPQRRAQAVLAVLAVCGDLGCTRERLVAMLWPESDEAHSRRALRGALHTIRHALGAGAVASSGEALSLDPGVISSDVGAFAQALRSGRPGDAVRARGGQLLEGFHLDGAPEFERWLDGERARVEREYGEALAELADGAEGRGAWGEAASWWARAEEHDPLNSALVLRHAEALAATGDRANAIKIAEAHVRRLRDELDLEADHEVLARIERLRHGDVAAPVTRPLPPSVRLEPAPAAHAAGLEPAPAAGVATPAAGRRPRLRWAAGLLALLLVAAGALAGARWLRSRASRPHPRTTIAVLPFEYFGSDSSRAYLADALHDELLTGLQGVGALQIIGRISVLGYARTAKPLRVIADELGAGSIVEGTVEVVDTAMRVNVQLLDPVTQTHIWAKAYDRPLQDVLAVQSDIVRRVVEALGGRLTAPEAQALAVAPTQNDAAYQLYLQGLWFFRRSTNSWEDRSIAQHMFERAVFIDPKFALAHAALSKVHNMFWCEQYDPSPHRFALVQREAEAALRLAPDLPEAHEAAGLGYWCHGEFRQALGEFSYALRRAPNDVDLWKDVGRVYRELGNWDSMDVAFRRAARLDPADALLGEELTRTYWLLRRYPEAAAACRRDVLCLGWIYAVWKGDLDTLGEASKTIDRVTRASVYGLGTWSEYFLWKREPDSLLALLKDTRETVVDPVFQYRPVALYAGLAYRLKGDSAAAQASFASALALLDSAVLSRPNSYRVHGSRGVALAGLGRRREALAEARWLQPNRKLTPGGVVEYGEERAYVLAIAGEADSALAQLERLLAGPSWKISVPILRIDPRFDGIRADRRFTALLAKYQSRG